MNNKNNSEKNLLKAIFGNNIPIENKEAYCPDCKYFGLDCSVDKEDYDKPCSAFEYKEVKDENDK